MIPRTLSALAVTALAGTALLAGCGQRAPVDPAVVATIAGPVRGVADADGSRVFRGIPYGSAPRWQPPAAPPPWTAVRDATRPGRAACRTFGSIPTTACPSARTV